MPAIQNSCAVRFPYTFTCGRRSNLVYLHVNLLAMLTAVVAQNGGTVYMLLRLTLRVSPLKQQ
jgi:hypothetical protein